MSYRYKVKSSPNYSSRARYGYGSKVTGITIHHWGSTGQSHDGVVAYLTRPRGNTSAHYVVSDGRVTQLVDDGLAAWHAGSNKGNGTTIGIECRPEMSDGDFDTLVELCIELERVHGSLQYYRHSDWKATACPGKYASRIGELIDRVNAGKGGKPTAKPKPKPKPKRGGKLDVDGKWGSGTTRRLQEVLGTPVDGRVSAQPVAFKAANPGLLSGWEWTGSPRSSNVIEALQAKLGVPKSKRDGRIGPDTIRRLQQKLGTPVDGRVSNPSMMVEKLQANLNAGKLW